VAVPQRYTPAVILQIRFREIVGLSTRTQVVYADDMQEFAKTCEAIAATTKKLQKTAIVAEYLKSRPVDEAAVAAVFLSGRPFPVWEETTLQVGGRSLWAIVAELAGKEEAELTSSYRRLGDLGAVAGDVLPERPGQGLGVLDLEHTFRQIAAARGTAAKTALVRDLLARATSVEAKYIVKIMTGDLRIGLKESLVEEAIATPPPRFSVPTCCWATSGRRCGWLPKAT